MKEELKSSLEETAKIINLSQRSCTDVATEVTDVDVGYKRGYDVASLPRLSLPLPKKPKPLVIDDSGTKKLVTSVSLGHIRRHMQRFLTQAH